MRSKLRSIKRSLSEQLIQKRRKEKNQDKYEPTKHLGGEEKESKDDIEKMHVPT